MTKADRRYVQPAPGAKVRDPLSKQHLPVGGAEVTWSPYWARRLKDKSIVEAAAPATRSKAAKSAPEQAPESVSDGESQDQ